MQNHADIKASFIYRFSEKALPIIVWLTITMPLWLSPFRPAVASYLILAYFIYFLYKAVKMAYYGTISLRLMNKASRTHWDKLLAEEKDADDIQHYILLVIATESEEKVTPTLEWHTKQKYDLNKVHVVLALEKGIEGNVEKGKRLIKKYRKHFGSMQATYHVLKEGEVVGKASNAAFAAKFITKDAKKRGFDPKKTVVTVSDADSLLPEQYLSYLTYKFIYDKHRTYRFFAAPVLLYNHFWKLPFPVRMQMMLSSVSRLGFLSLKEDLIQISTYSTNLWLLEKVNYWDVDIIPEDWHIWMQAFFDLGDRVKTIPLYLPIVRDGVLRPTLWKTLHMRYEQEKRWAWGATDVPYILTRFFNSPHIPFTAKLRRLLFVTENHFMWPTAFFVLTISASIPGLVNPAFERTVLGLLLPKLASFILTAASGLILLTVYFDLKLRKRVNIETGWKHVPMLFIQWYFLPIVSFMFSSLPALEAHTRMLIGKKLEYKTTKKDG